MQTKLKNHQNVTKLFALGGLEEVGKNTYCIEKNNEIIIIDAGIKFPDQSLLGVNLIIPDYEYLVKNETKIKALFITHGHEDHIGGIPYLLKKIKLPVIYAPQLASDLIKLKLEKHNLINRVKIIEYDQNTKIKFKNFKISFFQVTHSIPNSFGICVKTIDGNIVTTGDFKLDLTPLRNKVGFSKIAKIANEGVSILMSDSTNSEIQGYTLTEKKIMKNIYNLFLNTKKRILFTTFASNVDRIYEIIMIAKKIDRKIAVLGKAIENIIEIVKKRKYLNIKDEMFISKENIKSIKPEKLIVICTGSQGEGRSIISKIADNREPYLKGGENDLLIFSSRPIPGNKYKVENLINKLRKNKIQVEVCSLWKKLHTSGHANQEEQKMMITLMQPDYFMPMHGEYRMLKIHGETAKSIGIKQKNIFICKNGDQIFLKNKKAWIGKKMNVSPIYIGKNQNEDSMQILQERQIMLRNGIVGILLRINLIENKIIENPVVTARGSFVASKEINLNQSKLNQLTTDIEMFLKKNQFNYEQISLMVQEKLGNIIYQQKKINPIIVPIILTKKIN